MKVESEPFGCANNKKNQLNGKMWDGTTSGNKNITEHKCEELCRNLPKCTGFNWAPKDRRCWALNGCENPKNNPGYRLYYMEGNLCLQSC